MLLRLQSVLFWIAFLSILSLSILTLPFFSQRDLWFELNHDRTPYYLLAWVVFALWIPFRFLISRSSRTSLNFLVLLFSFAFIVRYTSTLYKYYQPPFNDFQQQKVLQNLRSYRFLATHSADQQHLNDVTLSYKPDLLVSLSSEEPKAFKLYDCFSKLSLSDGTHVASYYSGPCLSEGVMSLGDGLPGALVVDITVSGERTVPFVVFRALDEGNYEGYYQNHLRVRRLTTSLRHLPEAIVFNSFHSTTWSDHYTRMRGGADLFDASWGRGYQTSFSAPWYKKLLISEAALYKGRLSAREFRWLPSVDGERRDLLVTFDI